MESNEERAAPQDIPCNKNIYYANTLIKLNSFGYKKFNILGAIILKWFSLGYISFKNKKKGVFNKETSFIYLVKDVSINNKFEKKLFDLIRSFCIDGILSFSEFEKLIRSNYGLILEIFDSSLENEMMRLIDKNHIYNRTSIKECKKKNVMDNKLYNDSKKLYGLKKYLDEFLIEDVKEEIDVELLNNYLMFAYLFGIGDKFSNQLKKSLVLDKMNIDYGTIEFLHKISFRTVDSVEEIKNLNKKRTRVRKRSKKGSSGGRKTAALKEEK